MTVLHFAETFSATSETFIYDYVRGLEEAGVDNRVVAYRRANPDSRPFEDVSLVEWPGRWNLRRLWHRAEAALGGRAVRTATWPVLRSRLRRVVQRVEPDVVHAHFGPAGVMVAPVAEAEGIPLVTTFYGYDVSTLLGQAFWRQKYASALWPVVDAATVLSNDMRRTVVDAGCPAERVRVVHLCRDLDAFPFRPPDGLIRSLLSVGRLVDKKGHRDALRVLHNVRREGRDVHLHLIGGGPNEAALRSHARELGVGDAITFHGKVSSEEVAQRMAGADAFVLCSRTAPNGDREGTPTVLIEAQAAGLPCVSTRHAGIPEMIPDENHCFLAPEGDVDALTGCLLDLLDRPPEDVQSVARRGRAHVENEFSLATAVSKLRRLYRAVHPAGRTAHQEKETTRSADPLEY